MTALPAGPSRAVRDLSALFFLSGFAALTYQVVWQRLLYTAIGVDVVSMAVVVSVFMLGLGLGALFGGFVADRGQRLIEWFSGIEFAIGLFGLMSAHLILMLAGWIPTSSLVVAAAFSFVVLLLPTALMGATLPILVIYADRAYGNIGAATGRLYFYNTLGAATGAAATGFVLFNYFRLDETTYLAAAINMMVGFAALTTARRNLE